MKDPTLGGLGAGMTRAESTMGRHGHRFPACLRGAAKKAGRPARNSSACRGVRLDCLRLTRFPQALLINFNVSVLRHGITSVLLNSPKSQ